MSYAIRINENKRVVTIYPNINQLTDDQLKELIIVENIPNKFFVKGKHPVRYYDENKNEVYIKQEDRPYSDEEFETRINQLEGENLDLWDIVLFGGDES